MNQNILDSIHCSSMAAKEADALGFVMKEDGSFARVESPLADAVPANPEFVDGVASKDVVLDGDLGLWARIFRPLNERRKKLPVLVFYHGGGFLYLSAASIGFDKFCRQLSAKLGAIVVSGNYRLAPEHKLPAAYQDGFAILKWVLAEKSNQDFADADFSKLFVMGDSAGGNLTHHVAMRAAPEQGFKLAGQILIQPFFGGVSRSDSELRLGETGEIITNSNCDFFWKLALPEGSDRDHSFCNVTLNLRRELPDENFPKSLVVIGGLDPLSQRGREYAEILQEAGKNVKLVLYENADHGFYAQPELLETHLVLDEIALFCA